MTDLQAEYDAAVAEREELQAELGDAIIAGSDTSKLAAKLAEAEQAVAGCALAIEAIVSANQRAERRAADDAAAKRRAEIEAQWQQAKHDHNDILATVEALQRNFDKQVALLERLHLQAQAFSNNHRSLGCNGGVMHVLRNENWLKQIILSMRERVPGMRLRLSKVVFDQTDDPARNLAFHVPAFDAIFPPLAKREAA
jgi:hypothetical protein